jgi:uncharacterized protein DUF4154
MAFLSTTRSEAILVRLSLGIALGVLLNVNAYGQTLDEYQVKAAFLYNFAKFVEWPAQAFHAPMEPMVICVAGQDPFAGVLQDTVKGKEVGGRPLLVRNISEGREPAGCQILFVAASERKHFSAVLDRAKKCSLLTVGQAEGFTAAGGVINFKLEDGRLHFEINVEAAKQQDLRISSKLLNLAERVKK